MSLPIFDQILDEVLADMIGDFNVKLDDIIDIFSYGEINRYIIAISINKNATIRYTRRFDYTKKYGHVLFGGSICFNANAISFNFYIKTSVQREDISYWN